MWKGERRKQGGRGEVKQNQGSHGKSDLAGLWPGPPEWGVSLLNQKKKSPMNK